VPNIENSFNNVHNSEINITLNSLDPSELVTHITEDDIAKAIKLTLELKKELEKRFYFIDDGYETIFNIVCNDLDIKNSILLAKLHSTISNLSNSSYWLLGNGGEGKSTTLIRLAVECVIQNKSSFYIDFEHPSLKEDAIVDMIKYIKHHTNNKAYIFIDNPDIKIDLIKIFFKQIIKYNFEFIIVLAERKNRYEYLLNTNKDALYITNHPHLENFTVMEVPNEIKRLVYEKFYELLGEKNQKIEEIINTTINEKDLAFVNATYKILYELSKTRFITYKFDWLEYKDIAEGNFPSLKDSYKYIAFFYYFRIRVPFSIFEKLFPYQNRDLDQFIKYYSETGTTEQKEPIIFEEVKLNKLNSIYFLRAKHEIVAELFFDDMQYSNEEFTKIFIDVIKIFDENDSYQVNSLIQLFGNKQIHLDSDRKYRIDFSFIDDILKDDFLTTKFKTNFNLYGSIYLARFWTLIENVENKDYAVKFLEKAVKEIPQDLHFKTELAKVYQTLKKYDDAEKVLLDSLEIDNKQLHPRTELAKVYQTLKKYDDAEKVLLDLLVIDEDNLQARTELAKVYQTLKKYDDAEKVLLDLLVIDEDNLQARTELAKVYQTLKKYDDAEKVLLDLLVIDEDNLQARTELAKVYQTLKKYDDAEKVLLACIDISPKDLNSRTELAKVYQTLKKYDDAEKVLLACIDISPKDLNSRTELAKVYQTLKKYDDAEKVLLDLLVIDKDNLQARTELAKVYQTLKKYDDAIKYLKEYIKLDPNGLHPRTELAKVYQTLKKYDDAEKVLLDLLVIDKDNLQARTELAKVYQTLKKYDDAEKVLLESLEIDNKQLHPRTELAKVYQALKKYDDAIKYLKEYIKLDPNGLHPRTELAKVYQALKKYDDAEKVLLESLSINRFDFYAMAGLIRLYSDISKPRKAFKKVDEFLSQKGLKFFGGSSSRAHQALFNNLFFLCKRYRYFNEAKKYYKNYENILDSRNINSYNFNIKEKNFTYKEKDLIGFVQEIDDHKIVIDNKKYKNYRFEVEVGTKVIFDLDFSHNIRNIEKLD